MIQQQTGPNPIPIPMAMGDPINTTSYLEGSSFVPSGTPYGKQDESIYKTNQHQKKLREKGHEPTLSDNNSWYQILPSSMMPKYIVRKDDK